MDSETAVEAFAALAQDTRLEICKLLTTAGNTGMTAGDIGLALGVAQNTLSFHLSHMERSGLLKLRRQGRYRIYALNGRFVDELILFLAETCRDKAPKDRSAA
jgi:ArsR family transcriptional regulator, arsenate/arsenite/antimonite-responsive transcriptional repressor